MRKRDIKNITDHASVSEKCIEAYLTDEARKRGLICLKYSNANMAGFPDRLLVLPEGKVAWVELKSKGQKPSLRQKIRHAALASMGHRVHVIDNKPDIDKLLDELP